MMNKRRLLLPVLALLALASCNKDEEDDTLSYLSGTMRFTTPHYVEVGDTCIITPKGVTHPSLKSDSLGYYYSDSMFGVIDTVKVQESPASSFKSIKHVFGCSRKSSAHSVKPKDTLGTFTITFSAFAADYYSVAGTNYYVVVKEGYGEGHSLWKGFTPIGETVNIEGRDYYVTEIAGRKWLRENLASGTLGRPLDNCKSMKNILGLFYTWQQAVDACPSGWHLPSKAEWESALAAAGGHISGLLGDVYFNGADADDKMWEYRPEVGKITDSTMLSLLPAGYAQVSVPSADPSEWGYSFHGLWNYGAWWTSDTDPSDPSESALCARIYEAIDGISFDAMPKSYFAASVRCVKD